jgi:hypothetical protein
MLSETEESSPSGAKAPEVDGLMYGLKPVPFTEAVPCTGARTLH